MIASVVELGKGVVYIYKTKNIVPFLFSTGNFSTNCFGELLMICKKVVSFLVVVGDAAAVADGDGG